MAPSLLDAVRAHNLVRGELFAHNAHSPTRQLALAERAPGALGACGSKTLVLPLLVLGLAEHKPRCCWKQDVGAAPVLLRLAENNPFGAAGVVRCCLACPIAAAEGDRHRALSLHAAHRTPTHVGLVPLRCSVHCWAA